MFSYIFFLLSNFRARSLVRLFGIFPSLSLLLSLLLFALCIHIRFNSSLFYFVFFIFQYVSFLSRSYCVYTHTQNKWFENVFFILFRLLYLLSVLFISMCKPLYHIVNAFVHSKQYY